MIRAVIGTEPRTKRRKPDLNADRADSELPEDNAANADEARREQSSVEPKAKRGKRHDDRTSFLDPGEGHDTTTNSREPSSSVEPTTKAKRSPRHKRRTAMLADEDEMDVGTEIAQSSVDHASPVRAEVVDVRSHRRAQSTSVLQTLFGGSDDDGETGFVSEGGGRVRRMSSRSRRTVSRGSLIYSSLSVAGCSYDSVHATKIFSVVAVVANIANFTSFECEL